MKRLNTAIFISLLCMLMIAVQGCLTQEYNPRDNSEQANTIEGQDQVGIQENEITKDELEEYEEDGFSSWNEWSEYKGFEERVFINYAYNPDNDSLLLWFENNDSENLGYYYIIERIIYLGNDLISEPEEIKSMWKGQVWILSLTVPELDKTIKSNPELTIMVEGIEKEFRYIFSQFPSDYEAMKNMYLLQGICGLWHPYNLRRSSPDTINVDMIFSVNVTRHFSDEKYISDSDNTDVFNHTIRIYGVLDKKVTFLMIDNDIYECSDYYHDSDDNVSYFEIYKTLFKVSGIISDKPNIIASISIFWYFHYEFDVCDTIYKFENVGDEMYIIEGKGGYQSYSLIVYKIDGLTSTEINKITITDDFIKECVRDIPTKEMLRINYIWIKINTKNLNFSIEIFGETYEIP